MPPTAKQKQRCKITPGIYVSKCFRDIFLMDSHGNTPKMTPVKVTTCMSRKIPILALARIRKYAEFR